MIPAIEYSMDAMAARIVSWLTEKTQMLGSYVLRGISSFRTCGSVKTFSGRVSAAPPGENSIIFQTIHLTNRSPVGVQVVALHGGDGVLISS